MGVGIPYRLPRLRIGALPALIAALSSVFKTRTDLQLKTMPGWVLRARTVVRNDGPKNQEADH